MFMSHLSNIHIKEKIRLIKYNRLDGNERCLINTLKDVIKEELGDTISWYNVNGSLLFKLVTPNNELLISTLYVDYKNIWEFYSEYLGLNYLTIHNLIKKIVPEYLNIKEKFVMKCEKPSMSIFNYVKY